MKEVQKLLRPLFYIIYYKVIFSLSGNIFAFRKNNYTKCLLFTDIKKLYTLYKNCT